MPLTDSEINQLVERFGHIAGEKMAEAIKDMALTLKNLEISVATIKSILGEEESSGMRGEVVRHRERLHDLEHFKTEIKSKVGIVSTIAAAVVSAAIWIIERLSKG